MFTLSQEGTEVGCCGIIADDLTGANAAGVLLTKAGFKIMTIVRSASLEAFDVRGCDVVVVNAMSRGLAAEAARAVVKADTQALMAKGVRYFCKRVDSTIRGNPGAEVEGMLEALGPDYVAVCVPAFPASGRIAVGGYLLVNAVPVARTAAGRDPLKPVRNSYLPDVFAEQTALPTAVIALSTVAQGTSAVCARLRQEVASGKRIIIVDSASEDDIEVIACAVVQSGIKAISVDPGPFTQKLFPRCAVLKPAQAQSRVLVVAGSVTELTRAQVDHLAKGCGAKLICLNVNFFLDGPCSRDTVEQLAREVAEAGCQHEVFGFRVAETPDMVFDLAAEARTRAISTDMLSQRITDNLAQVARRALELCSPPVKGIYVTGGDVTVAVCNALGAHAIELEDEIIPLAAYGSLRGGPFDGLKITTKGGLIGVHDTAWHCIKYMTQKDGR